MLEKIGLTQSEIEEITEKFDDNLLKTMIEEETLFLENYYIFKKYNFDYINEIVVYFLPIFTNDSLYLENKLKELITELGEEYLDKIGEDLTLLEVLL